MDIRVLLFLVVLSAGWCCNARMVTTYFISTEDGIASELQINEQHQKREVEAIEGFGRNNQLCTLCEEYTTLALGYLTENKTQKEIMDILHKSCSRLFNMEEQCITLVDYYAPLFFFEASKVQPEEFCRRIYFCGPVVYIPKNLSNNSCDLCHQVVSEALLKLEDPDTQLEIVELLLKVCDAVESHAKKCKKLVFEYAPIILVNAEKFLEKEDICNMLHACSSATTATEQASNSQTSMHSAY